MAKNPILILGVGNPLRRDDGIGPMIIDMLSNNTDLSDQKVDLLDGGTDGLALMDYMQNYKHVIIIDAVEMKTPPGEIKVFSPAEAKMSINLDALSTHGFGLAEVIKMMEALDQMVPMTIIGIQPESIEFFEGLSSKVAAKIPTIIELVNKTVIQHSNKIIGVNV